MRLKIIVLIFSALAVSALGACAPLPPARPGAALVPPSASPLSPAEVFARIAPSVAFVDTPTGTGSGFLIQDGYLVTNAHVVYPFPTVRVVFSDGSEFAEAPVLNWDLMADLAVVGPLDTALPGLSLVVDEDLPMGSPTYLIGYPQEIETFPQPSITAGVLSRRREWDTIGITYLQSDALTLGGQSGGVLVSAHGEVLGVSGLVWPGFSQFALVASSVDLLPRIRALLAGEYLDGLGRRGLPAGDPESEIQLVLQHRYDTRAFQVLGEPGDSVTVTLTGAGAFQGMAFDFAGFMYEQEEAEAEEPISWEFEYGDLGPVVLHIEPLAEGPLTVTVRSSQPLLPFVDPDDDRTIRPGQAIFGSIDHPADFDTYLIDLEAGQTIEARLDSLAFDPLLEMTHCNALNAPVVSDSDSGGGLYEDAAQITYRARTTDTFCLMVKKDVFPFGFFVDITTGGYHLTVKEVEADATESEPEADSEAGEGDEEGADTIRYMDPDERFSLVLPPDWRRSAGFEAGMERFLDPEGGALQISTVDILVMGLGELSLADYVDVLVDYYQATQKDFILEARTTLETDEGLIGEVLVFTDLGGRRKSSEFIYTADGKQAVTVIFSAALARHAALEALIERTFKSFRWLD